MTSDWSTTENQSRSVLRKESATVASSVAQSERENQARDVSQRALRMAAARFDARGARRFHRAGKRLHERPIAESPSTRRRGSLPPMDRATSTTPSSLRAERFARRERRENRCENWPSQLRKCRLEDLHGSEVEPREPR